MVKKRIILLSLLLGLAIALLGLLLLIMGRSRGRTAAVHAAAQTTPAATEAPVTVVTARPTTAPTEDPRLFLSTGPIDRSVATLTLSSLTKEDLDVIRQLNWLTLLDGRACENYALLRAFSETVAYPVLWSVPLGGTRVDSDTVELVVPADVTDPEAVLAALEELPNLETVDLRASGLDNAGALALREAKPEITVLYDVTVQGSKLDADTRTLELEAKNVSDWDTLAREIGYLRDLEGIAVNGAVTPEQAAYLLEGAGSIPVRYSVSFRGRTIDSEDTEADFSDLPSAELGAIKSVLTVLPNIRRVNLDPAKGTSKWTLDEADQLQTFREGMVVNYTTKYFGVSFSLADEVVSFNKKNLKKKLNELKELLPYLRNVKRVDMENCRIDNETMAALRDEFPQPKLVWRVTVGGYSVRTDAWMIKFSAGGSRALYDKDCANLKYCREIKYLDLGHNKIKHLDFVAYMPDLEVCIMYNPMSNIQGIENCPKLEFFECYSCGLMDLSPLSACTELKHLNVCYNNLTDITPLYGLTKLERLWIARNNIPAEQIEQFKELVPGCEVNTTTHNPTRGGWRYFDEEFTQITPRYALLREQFQYDHTNLRSYGDGWYEEKTVHNGPLPTAAPEN